MHSLQPRHDDADARHIDEGIRQIDADRLGHSGRGEPGEDGIDIGVDRRAVAAAGSRGDRVRPLEHGLVLVENAQKILVPSHRRIALAGYILPGANDEGEAALRRFGERPAEGYADRGMTTAAGAGAEKRPPAFGIVDNAEKARHPDIRGDVPDRDRDVRATVAGEEIDHCRIVDSFGIDACRGTPLWRRLPPERQGVSLDRLAQGVESRLGESVAGGKAIAAGEEITAPCRLWERKIEGDEFLRNEDLGAVDEIAPCDPADRRIARKAPQPQMPGSG